MNASAREGKITEIRLSDVVSALSYALDITEGQPEGHGVRSCMIGMSLAEHLQLSSERRSALFYALLLKDLGCSSNAAKVCYLFGADDHQLKHRLKLTEWSSLLESARYAIRSAAEGRSWLQRARRIFSLGLQGQDAAKELIEIRCERGADIARMLEFPAETAAAIRALDEHWDGRGHPTGLRGDQIPLLARVLGLAQTVEVFYSDRGRQAAVAVVAERRGTWFDPELCDLFFEHLADDPAFWQQLEVDGLIEAVGEYEPADRILKADEQRLDQIAAAFARVIDAKSPYTYQHSARVSAIAVEIAAELGMSAADQRDIARAALLHDIGKLSVSNMILDKPGKLDESEWRLMRQHPAHTHAILSRVAGFSQLAEAAAAHHERPDGNGYHRGEAAAPLSRVACLLAVADKFEALTADRPYRQAMSAAEALALMEQEVGSGVAPAAFAALRACQVQGRLPTAQGAHRHDASSMATAAN